MSQQIQWLFEVPSIPESALFELDSMADVPGGRGSKRKGIDRVALGKRVMNLRSQILAARKQAEEQQKNCRDQINRFDVSWRRVVTSLQRSDVPAFTLTRQFTDLESRVTDLLTCLGFSTFSSEIITETESQWLFEVPFTSEATSYTNPEWEAEWELQDANPSVSSSSRKQAIRETVSGFSRYSNAIPPHESAKILRLAQLIVQSHRSSQPIRTIRLLGHADRDIQRGANFEKKISGDRALAVKKALIQLMDKQRPNISVQIRWQVVPVGASQLVVKLPKNESDRKLNRRVEIFVISTPSPPQPSPPICNAINSTQCEQEFERCIKKSNNPLACLAARSVCYRSCPPPTPPIPPTPSAPPPLPIPSSTPSPPIARTCCILAPTLSPFSSTSNLVNPKKLGEHRGNDEATGLMYTGKAGFFDLGHARDLCDLTKYVYDQIVAVSGVPVTIRTIHGIATIHTSVPSSAWIQVARAISYDDSFAYEIFTYDVFIPGGHNSSFSPEDLCSNYLGTLLAEKAILAGGTFNAAVTNQLNTMVGLLDAQTEVESLKAFGLINSCWVSFGGPGSLLKDNYLKRRNFDRMPWFTGHPSDASSPSWVTSGFGNATTFYTYTHKTGPTIDKADFPKELARIRTDAAKRYGPKFDDRKCP